jgi:dephospho-CoA kinase
MLKIALTGGIATGKSYILAQLRERGVPTIDADAIVHELFEPDTAVTQAVALEFGKAILREDGRVDRAVLASKVFSNDNARLRLEAIVHPVVYDRLRQWFAVRGRPLGVASIPLLYETHREGDFDAVIVTACGADQQLTRLLARGLSEEDARLRMAAQMPADEKARKADYVIRTGGTMGETSAQLDEVVSALRLRMSSQAS